MVLHKILLLGATGETGGDILDGLVEDGGFVSGGIFNSCFVVTHILSRISAALSNQHLPISPRSTLFRSVVSVLSLRILKEIRIFCHSL